MIIIEIFERGATPGHRPTALISVIKIDTHEPAQTASPQMHSLASLVVGRPW